MLTHANILANVDSLAQIFPLSGSATASSASCPSSIRSASRARFGFRCFRAAPSRITRIRWTPRRSASWPRPTRARMLISTPTFCQSYVRRCTKEQFAHLRYAIVGAEKLREPLATAFEEQFGIPLLEGYGCTEMAPVVAVNRPNVEHHGEKQIGSEVRIGRPSDSWRRRQGRRSGDRRGPARRPGGSAAGQGPEHDGRLLEPARATAEVMRDGWYVTATSR